MAKKIRDTLGLAGGQPTVWKENFQRFDFIFEISDTTESLTFRRLQYFVNGEEELRGKFVQSIHDFEYKGKTFKWFQTTIPRTRRRSFLFGAWTKNVPIDGIDLDLRYYCGPPNEPICTFKGPFKAEQKMVDETGLYEISFVPHPDPSQKELVLRCCAKQEIDEGAHALFYDDQGKRHYTGKGWQRGKWKPGKATREELWYTIPGMRPEVTLNNFTMITIGEEPLGITVKNLRLSSPGSEHRTYAEHLDKIAERLKPKRSATYWDRLRDPNDALEVADLLRGDQIYQLCRSLCFMRNDRPRFDSATLDTEQAKRLRHAALRWTKTMDPEIRAQAVSLGLHCKWPEFVDPAFDLMEYSGRNRSRTSSPAADAARALCYYRDHISDRDIQRIAELLLRQTDRGDFYLQDCLEHPKSPSRIKALWDLAGGEQSKLWTWAIRQLSTWREFEGKCDSLSEKLKVRVYLIAGPYGFSNPDQTATKVAGMLPSLLSSHPLTDHAGVYGSLLIHVPKSIDRRAMTSVMIESLRNTKCHRNWSQWETISKIVKYLNLWYDLNIGGLGTDVRRTTSDLDKMDLEAVAAEAVEWYDTVYKGADPNAIL